MTNSGRRHLDVENDGREDGVLMIDDTHGSSGYARHRRAGEAKRTDRVDSVKFKAPIYT